jgi:hypothetical protein
MEVMPRELGPEVAPLVRDQARVCGSTHAA